MFICYYLRCLIPTATFRLKGSLQAVQLNTPDKTDSAQQNECYTLSKHWQFCGKSQLNSNLRHLIVTTDLDK